MMMEHSNTQSLPGIQKITKGLYPCRQSGCTTYASSQAELVRHERSCRGFPEVIHKQPSWLQQAHPFPSQPYRLQTQFEAHSSPSSVDGDSDNSSIIMTPDVSRAPSLCSYPTSRRQSGVIRTEKGRGRKSVSVDASVEQCQGDVNKRTKKMKKEKANRGDQGAVLQRQEDAFACYTGWSRQEQSGGNGNGAGLQANKITLLLAQEGLLYYMMHRGLTDAIREDREEEWQAEIRSVLDRVIHPARNPYESTFLAGSPVQCWHEAKGKACMVHNQPDWRDCRLSQRRQIFDEMRASFAQPERTKVAAKRAPNTFSCRK